MFAVCNASVPLAALELESLFWPARRQRYKEFLVVSGVPLAKTLCIIEFCRRDAGVTNRMACSCIFRIRN